MTLLSLLTLFSLNFAYAADEPVESPTENGAEVEIDDDFDFLEEGDLDDADDADDLETGEDLLGDKEDVINLKGPGVDNADIYRDYQKQVKGLSADEEMLSWEEYQDRYPNTLFKKRIEDRIEDLTGMLYFRLEREGDKTLDADQQELQFSQGLLLESINPRTRVRAGFEWGLPDYMNLAIDYEHQIIRQASAHAGIQRRQTGWSIETGGRYALLKSSRTRTIITAIADVRINTSPFFFAPRPQIGFGQKFGPVDLQAQTGVEIDTREGSGVPFVGGGSVTVHTTDRSAAFVEAAYNIKPASYTQQLEGDDGQVSSTERDISFRFNTMSFGMKMYPKIPNDEEIEVTFGASLPFATSYWMLHYGSIMAQVNYFM